MEIKDQPAPDGGWGNVQALVRADLEERERIGVERYGSPLRLFNGRDALVDAYQEAMDLTVYLRQAITERNFSPSGDDSPARSETSTSSPVTVYQCANPTCRFAGVMVEVPVNQIGHFRVCPELRCSCGFEPSMCG
jgi:hypothetical protein